MISPSYIILRIQKLKGSSVDLDEVAHFEPPHQDLRCLQTQLFSSLVHKELNAMCHNLSNLTLIGRRLIKELPFEIIWSF